MFDKQGAEIRETADARKHPISGDAAWDLLKKAGEIIVGQGKQALVYKPSEAAREEILGHCLGKTGNLRAPALKIGKKLIIGFNEEMYGSYLGK